MPKVIQMVTPQKLMLPQRKRVAAYARVSSGKDAMLHSMSAQISYYSWLIQNNPEWYYAGVYADEAVTGTRANREQFQKMIADARAGKLDMIITKSISRFARNTVTLLETVRELKQLGVDVFFEEQNIHSMSGDGELMLTILASFAQEESRSVSENCKWRIRRKFEQGIPTTTRMNGLKFDHGKVMVISREALTVQLIFRLRRAGMGKNAISRELNRLGIPAKNGGLWNDSVIDSILRNEKYQGDLLLQKYFRVDHIGKVDYRNNGELPQYEVRDNHEAIISREDFREVQELIQKKAATFPAGHGQHSEYPFTSKLICDNCGKHYRRRINNGKIAWQCTTFMARGRDYCAAKQIRESILEEAAAAAMGLTKFDPTAFSEQVEWIRVLSDNRLLFHFFDGREDTRTWEPPSRRDSWTPEMKKQAAEHTRRRYTT